MMPHFSYRTKFCARKVNLCVNTGSSLIKFINVNHSQGKKCNERRASKETKFKCQNKRKRNILSEHKTI